MKYSFAFVILVSLFVSSCAPKISTEKQEQLNELSLRADSSLQELNSLDTAKAFANASHFWENVNFIQNKMTDTIDVNTAKTIDRYYALRKAFKLFQANYSKSLKEMELCKKQIQDLNHDVNNDIVDETQFDRYYHLESNNIVLAEEAVNEVLRAINTILPIYDTLNPKIDSILAISKSSANSNNEN